jgi:hypothetical protein
MCIGLPLAAATGRFAIMTSSRTMCSAASPKNVAGVYDDMIAETGEPGIAIMLYDEMVARGLTPALKRL